MKLVKELDNLDSDDEELQNIEKARVGKKTARATEAAIKKKAKNDYSKFLPSIIMQLARVEMFAIIYTYHCPLNLIHLFWLLATFLLSDDNVFLLSMYSMLPMLFWEFLFIYGIRIPVVKDTVFMQRYGEYLQWPMKSRMSE